MIYDKSLTPFLELDFKNKTQRHWYHIVTQSLWPITGSVGALFLTFGSALFFHFFLFSSILLFSGITLILTTMFIWWRDVVREATWTGSHPQVIQTGLRVGIILFIITEVMFFFAFFWSFFHSSLAPVPALGSIWPPCGIVPFDPKGIPLLNTGILLWSGCTLTLSHHGLRMGNTISKHLGLFFTILLAIQFTFYQIDEYIGSYFALSDGVYGTTFYMATGLHGLHVIIGTIFLIICAIRMLFGQFTKTHHVGYEAAIWYWHFVDVVWLFLFATVYCWGSGMFFDILCDEDIYLNIHSKIFTF